MTTTLIALRHSASARRTQALLEASRSVHTLGLADSLLRTRAGLQRHDPETLLIELRLEDGAALSLVRDLRARGAERPKVMLVAGRTDDPLLFPTLIAGADAYLLEADLPMAAASLQRMVAGEATMSPFIAAEMLKFFRVPPKAADTADDRHLDWQTHAGNPMQLSPGECRLLRLMAAGARSGEVAARTAQSLESIGRRIGNLYRKLGWDVRSGALALLAA
jgi:DNA-binding NarL/FixJ family response regulator